MSQSVDQKRFTDPEFKEGTIRAILGGIYDPIDSEHLQKILLSYENSPLKKSNFGLEMKDLPESVQVSKGKDKKVTVKIKSELTKVLKELDTFRHFVFDFVCYTEKSDLCCHNLDDDLKNIS